MANLLLGGYDEEGAKLYYLDYLGSMHQMPFAIQGYASNFVLSIFDRYYKPDMSLEEGLEIAKLCIAELNRRFLLAQPDWTIKVIRKDGDKTVLDVISPADKEQEK
jgi:20S proteasome subunit beta 4